MYAYRESTPSTKLALVANCGGKAVSGDDLDRTELLFNETVDRDRFPYRVLSLLIDLNGRPVILGIGNHSSDPTEGAVVVRPA